MENNENYNMPESVLISNEPFEILFDEFLLKVMAVYFLKYLPRIDKFINN